VSKKPQAKAQHHRSNALSHWFAAIASVTVLIRSAHHGIHHAAAVAAISYVVTFLVARLLIGGRK
jgi:hypothetical protein